MLDTEMKPGSIFDRLRVKILLDHESYLEDDGVVKLPEIKPCDFLDFFKAVNKSIPVNKKLSGGFGDIEVILKESLNSKESFVVEALD